jgi:hypothetical protein
MSTKTTKIQYYEISENKYLFFDIFYKNNQIHLISPIYNSRINTNEFQIYANNRLLTISEEYIKDNYEPICIYKYDYISSSNIIDVNVEYNNRVQTYILEIEPDDNDNTNNTHNTNNINELTLTTLFKDDYAIFPLFYEYYKNQGVSHFYMYYNGKISDEIMNIFDLSYVTLIEWDFAYWNENCKYKHHAQMGQINHALYKYGKNSKNGKNHDKKYMIFCDMDEYMYIPDHKLIDFVSGSENANIDVFGFQNIWANTVDDIVPSKFPTEIRIANKLPYNLRSKNIYNVSSVNIAGIHNCMYFNKDPNACMNLSMFHFYNWSNKKRKEACQTIVKI